MGARRGCAGGGTGTLDYAGEQPALLAGSARLREGVWGKPVDLTRRLITRANGVQFLPWLKAHGLSWGDADLGAGAGIAADAGFAGADTENAESAQFDALACSQGFLEALEDCIDCGLRLGAGQAGALDDLMDDILLDQWGTLADAIE